MNDGTTQAYPAIDRALGILRARLLVEKGTPGVTVSSEEQFSAKRLTQGTTRIKEIENQGYNINNVARQEQEFEHSEASLKELVQCAAQRTLRIQAGTSKFKHLHKICVPVHIINLLQQAYKNHLIRLVLAGWKSFHANYKKQKKFFSTTVEKLSCIHELNCRLLSQATRKYCLNRLGKLKLAELFCALQLKRVVFVILLRNAISLKSHDNVSMS